MQKRWQTRGRTGVRHEFRELAYAALYARELVEDQPVGTTVMIWDIEREVIVAVAVHDTNGIAVHRFPLCPDFREIIL